jgi:membrane protein DedA with SNARE-associated domain
MIDLLLAHCSYLGIIIVLILTGSGLPIPEEVPVIAAGILSAHGQLVPWLAFASCLFGALAGDCVMYWIGRHFGRSVVREHPWWAHFVKPEREAQIEMMMRRHGLKVFFLARFLVGLRSPVYLSAGILRVPFRRFLLIDLFCATTVIGTFFGLSYVFGTTIVGWIRNAEYVLTGVVLLGLVGGGIYWWRRHRRKLAQQVSDPAATAVSEPQVEPDENVPPSADPPSADGVDWEAPVDSPGECVGSPKQEACSKQVRAG